ncbi:MAG: glutamate 5-kinase [Mariprofundaceae bacterium]|nr:glutamate 5-kinase [Mariprofundaceae bacterium]
MRSQFKHIRRLVLKVGSSLLADPDSGIRTQQIQQIAKTVHELKKRNIEVAIVSSGAVALGRVRLAWLDQDLSLHKKQAAAAVGQPMLMHAYADIFQNMDMTVAQMLLTRDDLSNRRRYLNASHTSQTLFRAGAVPIVNENDTVMTEEIRFGDNDTLGAMVSLLVHADLFVMMTDVDGLYTANPHHDPHAQRLGIVQEITDDISSMAQGAGSSFGTGGMQSKVKAARISTKGGIPAVIMTGQDPLQLFSLLDGQNIGTVFACGKDRQSRRQHWIADILEPKGKVWITKETAKMIQTNNKGVLHQHMIRVEGQFDKGDCIDIYDDEHRIIACGLANYRSDEIKNLLHLQGQDIQGILGYRDFESVIHQDNLVMRPVSN